MSKFEDHLWREVLREHGAGIAQTSRPPARSTHRSTVIAGTGLGLAGAGTVAALVLGGTAASPAFAVTRNHDGTVTVSITGYGGMAGANARLRELGISAEVVARAPSGCGGSMHGSPAPSHGAKDARWTINPRKVPAGRTLVLVPASTSSGRASSQVLSCRSGPMNGHRKPPKA